MLKTNFIFVKMAGNQFKYLNREYIDNQNDDNNNNNNSKWLNDNDLITKLGDNNRRKFAVSRSGRFKAKNKYRETINTDLFQQELIKDDKVIFGGFFFKFQFNFKIIV